MGSIPDDHLTVVVKYFPPTRRISGIIGFLERLLNEVSRQIRVTVVSHGPELAPDERERGGITHHRIGSPFPVRAARLVRSLEPGPVLVVSGIFDLPVASTYFSPLLTLGRDRIHFFQATNLHERSLGAGRRILPFASTLAASAATRSAMTTGARRPKLIHPAVDVAELAPVGQRPRAYDVGFVNHLNRTKGADRAARVIRRVLAADPGRRAAMAGTGEMELELGAGFAGDERLDRMGWLPYGERMELLASCRVLLFPFRTSVSVLGVSQTVLEAMALGSVVVGSDVACIGDAIEHQSNGILVSSEEDDDWVEAVEALLADERHRSRLAERARADAAAGWDIRIRARELLHAVGLGGS